MPKSRNKKKRTLKIDTSKPASSRAAAAAAELSERKHDSSSPSPKSAKSVESTSSVKSKSSAKSTPTRSASSKSKTHVSPNTPTNINANLNQAVLQEQKKIRELGQTVNHRDIFQRSQDYAKDVNKGFRQNGILLTVTGEVADLPARNMFGARITGHITAISAMFEKKFPNPNPLIDAAIEAETLANVAKTTMETLAAQEAAQNTRYQEQGILYRKGDALIAAEKEYGKLHHAADVARQKANNEIQSVAFYEGILGTTGNDEPLSANNPRLLERFAQLTRSANLLAAVLSLQQLNPHKVSGKPYGDRDVLQAEEFRSMLTNPSFFDQATKEPTQAAIDYIKNNKVVDASIVENLIKNLADKPNDDQLKGLADEYQSLKQLIGYTENGQIAGLDPNAKNDGLTPQTDLIRQLEGAAQQLYEEEVIATLPVQEPDNTKRDEIKAGIADLHNRINDLIAHLGDYTDPVAIESGVVVLAELGETYYALDEDLDTYIKENPDEDTLDLTEPLENAWHNIETIDGKLNNAMLLDAIKKVDETVIAIPATLPKVSDDNKKFDELITAATNELGRQIEAEQALIARIGKTDLTDPQRVVITQAMEKLHADIANVQDAIAKLKQDKINANELTGNTLLEDIRKVDDAVEAIPATLPKVSDDNKKFDELITAATTELGRQIEAEQALIARVGKTRSHRSATRRDNSSYGEAARRYRKRARRYR